MSTPVNDNRIDTRRLGVQCSRRSNRAKPSVNTGIRLLMIAECDGVVRDRPSTKRI